MLMSSAVKEVEEWMNLTSSSFYQTLSCSYIRGGATEPSCHMVEVMETSLSNNSKNCYKLYVYENGDLVNENHESVVEVSMNAYDNDPKMIEQLQAFRQKWCGGCCYGI